jgi:very-short-patch-repair endonuclease
MKMWPERQFLETIKQHNFYLDFAIFCKKLKLAVECNGDLYHMKDISVRKDKRRDNLLESNSWNVLRYTTYDLTEHLNDSVNQILETVNYYDGEEMPDKKSKYKFYLDKQKGSLFDEFHFLFRFFYF